MRPRLCKALRTHPPFTMSKSSPDPRRRSDRPGNLFSCPPFVLLRKATGGASRDRTDDPLLAKQVLSQLSYGPERSMSRSCRRAMVGLGRLELPTSRLSGVRSNHLSYRPETRAPNPAPKREAVQHA